ncbi:glycosyltransferase family A protein [Pontibacter pamirensis]|uniref:glycosyltransferase family A protein n=1 Tax=Pontibacter pamirensis TaxID=2562824 RepID=UPI001389C781|nr:glycosyltransferase family A protein [Pontibacter pamirensis]
MKGTSAQLGIVIPAYKGNYLYQTLNSLANQTDRRFNVYVANDAGDDTIEHTIDLFRDRLAITYKFFSKNIGSKSLVKAWHRAIELSQDEPWIWVLPDDDYISDNCVEAFYTALDNKCDLYRFRSIAVNNNEEVILANEDFSGYEPSFIAYHKKIKLERMSSLAEYIFRREKLLQIGGFPDYPFAWGSDDIAWYLIGRDNGIYALPKGVVYLRQSEHNISNNFDNKILLKKIKTQFQIFSDLKLTSSFETDISKYADAVSFHKDLSFYLFHTIRSHKIIFPMKEALEMAHLSMKIFGGSFMKNLYRIFLSNYRIRKEK